MVDLRRRAVSPACLGALVFSAAIFIRLAVSLHPYSGINLPTYVCVYAGTKLYDRWHVAQIDIGITSKHIIDMLHRIYIS